MPLIGLDGVELMLLENSRRLNTRIRGVFLSGLSAVIKATPVDEGRARNNWFLTTGSPFNGAFSRGPSSSGATSSSSLNTMPAEVLNQKVYFTNNLPYIETLEYGGYPNPSSGTKTSGGFSKQAPGGFVRKQIIRMKNKIRRL